MSGKRAERRVPLSIYIPKSMLERLKELAERDRRSLSTNTLLILEKALEELD